MTATIEDKLEGQPNPENETLNTNKIIRYNNTSGICYVEDGKYYK